MNNTTYSTGSVSVAASGTTVTGSGTAWLSSGIRAGDLIMIAGLTAQIAAVGTNTSLTLKRAWPGAAQSGANYDIIMLDDEVRGLIAANALLQALSGGTLTSLGQIAGAANQMPYWTGVGVMGSTGLTSEARSLIGSTLLSRSGNNLVTPAAARMTGGAVVASQTDTNAGRLLITGYMGLGSPLTLSNYDLDDMHYGFFGQDGAAAGPLARPDGLTGDGRWAGLTAGSSNARVQLAALTNGIGAPGSAYMRTRSTTGWLPWRKLLNAAGIVGTVSQSGGIPTGEIIERGSNASGDYVKFADGTMICWGVISVADVAVTTPYAGGFRSGSSTSLNFPAMFILRPRIVTNIQDVAVSDAIALSTSKSNTTMQVRLWRAAAATVAAEIEYIAIGRCF